MSAAPTGEIRPALETECAAAGVPAGALAFTLEADGARVTAALDPMGLATEPDAPTVRLVLDGSPDPDRAVAPVVARLLDAARAAGHSRLTIGWDPLDRPILRRLEDLGFRTTGTMPYFDLGGGQVEHVTGYRDPYGSILDLAIDL